MGIVKTGEEKERIIIVAITGITIMVSVALLKGIDGALFMAGLAAVGGLAGWAQPQPKFLARK